MHRLFLSIAVALCSITIAGCDSDDNGGTEWNSRIIWPEGSNPVPSPDGSKILFLIEGTNGGLYVLEDGNAVWLNEDGPAVRSDYAWSNDGSRICFSAPGLPGETETGIYVSIPGALNSFTRIWDRGSSPQFLTGDTTIICAGHEGNELDRGLWEIRLSNTIPNRIDNDASKVFVSPDAHKTAYFVTTGGSTGRLVKTYNHVTHVFDTVGAGAVDMTWLADSETIVYESVTNGFQQIFRLAFGDTLPGENILSLATHPRAFPTGQAFVYSAISGDETNGIYLYDNGDAAIIDEIGSGAIPVSADRIIAFSNQGLIEFTR